MNPNGPKILIISSDTGGGHRSAAAAIVAGLESFVKGESYAIRVIRAVEESHHLAAKLVAIYNWLLRNKQHWMKYYYWLINRFRPDSREFFYKRTVDYGIPSERIKISGMPVHPKFSFPGDDAARVARTALGLDPDKFTVFLNAGWEGGGNISHIFRELIQGQLDVQAIFLAGKNEALKSEAELIAAEPKFPVKVIGYSDEVEKLMRAANVM